MSRAKEKWAKEAGHSMVNHTTKLQDELDTLYAHMRAVVQNPDPDWTGWRHAIEMLIPDSPPRIAELQDELRDMGFGPLADRLDSQ